MIVTFAEPSALNWEFRTDLLVFGGLLVIITLAFEVSYRNSPLAMSFTMRCLLGLVGLSGVAWYAYASSYQQFIRAAVNDVDVRLTFVGPFSRIVVLPHRDIAAITYGLSDRGSSKCRVTIAAGGTQYHSAWVANEGAICRVYRDAMQRVLAGDVP
jgi:hypothetical protein